MFRSDCSGQRVFPMFQQQRMTPNIRVEREHQSSSQCSNSNDLAAVSLFASESLLLLEGSNLLFFWWSGVCWCTSLCQLHERFVWQNPLKVIGYHLLFLCRGCWCAWLAYCYYFSRWRMIVDKSLIIIWRYSTVSRLWSAARSFHTCFSPQFKIIAAFSCRQRGASTTINT